MTYLPKLALTNSNISGTLNKNKITGTAAVLNIDNTFSATQTVPNLKDTAFFAAPCRTITADTTVTSTDFTINCTSTTNSVANDITLPSSSSANQIVNISNASKGFTGYASTYNASYNLAISGASSTAAGVSTIYFQNDTASANGGTTSNVQSNYITDTTNLWSNDYFKGYMLVMGTSYAIVTGNTTSGGVATINFTSWQPSSPLPSAGKYYLLAPRDSVGDKVSLGSYVTDGNTPSVISSNSSVTGIVSFDGFSNSSVSLRPDGTKTFSVSQAGSLANNTYVRAAAYTQDYNGINGYIEGTATVSGTNVTITPKNVSMPQLISGTVGTTGTTLTSALPPPETRDSNTSQGTAPTSIYLYDNVQTWATNQWNGYYVLSYTAAGNPTYGLITGTTSARLQVSSWSNGTPALGQSYEIDGFAPNNYAQNYMIRSGASYAVVQSNTQSSFTVSAWTGGNPTVGSIFEIDDITSYDSFNYGDTANARTTVSPWTFDYNAYASGTWTSYTASPATLNDSTAPWVGGDFGNGLYRVVAYNSSTVATYATITGNTTTGLSVGTWSNGVPASATNKNYYIFPIWTATQLNGYLVKADANLITFPQSYGYIPSTGNNVTWATSTTTGYTNRVTVSSWTGGTPAVGGYYSIQVVQTTTSGGPTRWKLTADNINLSTSVTSTVAQYNPVVLNGVKVAVASSGLIDGSSSYMIPGESAARFQYKSTGNWVSI